LTAIRRRVSFSFTVYQYSGEAEGVSVIGEAAGVCVARAGAALLPLTGMM
jgi:hypothetical protein